MLIHEVPDQFGGARRPAGVLALLIGRDQARLRIEPRRVARVVRVPQPFDERARARRHYRSGSGLRPLHDLRINLVM